MIEQTTNATQSEPIPEIFSQDQIYEKWYQKLLSELRDISNKEGKVVLPYKYQMGKAIQKARREWDKAYPPTGPDGWTKARHGVMERLKRDLGVARSDLYACLRFVELGLRRKNEGWKSFEEFSDRRFSVRRGDSPQGETRVRGKDLTWKEVKEQVLRGKKRSKVEQEDATDETPLPGQLVLEGSSSPTATLPDIPPPAPVTVSSPGIYVPLSEDTDRRLREYLAAHFPAKEPGKFVAELIEAYLSNIATLSK